MFAIECHELGKAFYDGPFWSRQRKKVAAVSEVSFQVGQGEIFGLLGSNGSGKSTLIRMIAPLLIPDSGRIRILGHDPVAEPMAVRRLINRVAVDAAFFKKLSARENLNYASRLYGFAPSQHAERALRILEKLGLGRDKLDEPIEDMSRGMQQKVAIARALLSVPPVLLLDEPTTGLDPVSRRQVRAFIREIQQDQGTSILLTTHDMEEAEALCDRIAIMVQGRLVATGRLHELQQQVVRPGESAGAIRLEEIFFRLTGVTFEEAQSHVQSA
ncbi:MAG: ABC transporter ATP-binding protein [Candidatus Melainabacteria bacterium HGW-Melainabacteria-1]|nr:MAG: ABC transporter ATP-binding protein [Candidatus Melainabacteria bacterium HGW-Melainabacteria-1]